jgi:hemoglobin
MTPGAPRYTLLERVMRFRPFCLSATALLPILLLAACGEKAPSAPVEATKPATLYDRLGGQDGVAAIVNESISNIAGDGRINKFFRRANTARFRAQLNDQLCAASGGPCIYGGRSMQAAHQGMRITDAAFNAMVEDMQKAMTTLHVGGQEQDAMLALLEPMRGDIVTPAAPSHASVGPALEKPGARPAATTSSHPAMTTSKASTAGAKSGPSPLGGTKPAGTAKPAQGSAAKPASGAHSTSAASATSAPATKASTVTAAKSGTRPAKTATTPAKASATMAKASTTTATPGTTTATPGTTSKPTPAMSKPVQKTTSS